MFLCTYLPYVNVLLKLVSALFIVVLLLFTNYPAMKTLNKMLLIGFMYVLLAIALLLISLDLAILSAMLLACGLFLLVFACVESVDQS